MIKNLRNLISLCCYFFLLGLLLTAPGAVFAQVKFYTMVSERQPDISEYIQVDYTIENAKSVEKISAPVFKNFKIIQGPSQSTGMTYINGVMSQSKSLTFILQPVALGKMQVPGTVAIVDGKQMQAAPVTIEVRNSGSRNPSAPKSFPGFGGHMPEVEQPVSEEYVLKSGESFQDKIKNNLFVKGDVNKTTCYEGEPIMATFSLCSRLKSESRVTKRPSLNGFSVYDMIDPENNPPTVQQINGKAFNVHLIRKTQLFPLQAGTFVIDPVELDNSVRFVRAAERRSAGKTAMEQLMDDMMNDGVNGETEEYNITLASKPITITVKPLPLANKPAGFNGAVGKFTVEQVWKTKKVAAGDALEMELLIKGEGNFAVINAPAIDLPTNVDGYDPAIREDVDKSHYPLSGSKTFSYTFVPRDTGHFIIPAVNFSYFDPEDEQYKTAQSQDAEIEVTKAQKKSIFKPAAVAGEQVAGNSAAWEFFDEYKFVIFAGSALVALTAFGIYKREKRKRRRARRDARSKRVSLSALQESAPYVPEPLPVAPRNLFGDARFALAAGDSTTFYTQVNRSIWQFISERLHIASVDLNKYNVVTALRGRSVEEDTISNLQNLLNECEIAIYTPVHNAADMNNTLEKAESIVKSLNTVIG